VLILNCKSLYSHSKIINKFFHYIKKCKVATVLLHERSGLQEENLSLMNRLHQELDKEKVKTLMAKNNDFFQEVS